ncbi:hypothetical protein ACFQ4C_12520 [Larkinella insperata]|uniref:Uncharacterized protein n=1 Tax=Larkinella insperata TaxID=332158 RepID=A0ABW3Q7N1_9BACT|nr:hypothetical protein [Larkinella insperata]
MIIISGAHFAAMLPGRSYRIIANDSMNGNEALLFSQQLNVSFSVAQLLLDETIRDQVFSSLRIAIPESAPSV